MKGNDIIGLMKLSLAFLQKHYKSITDRPTDGPTDGRTDTRSYRDARTHLKIVSHDLSNSMLTAEEVFDRMQRNRNLSLHNLRRITLRGEENTK